VVIHNFSLKDLDVHMQLHTLHLVIQGPFQSRIVSACYKPFHISIKTLNLNGLVAKRTNCSNHMYKAVQRIANVMKRPHKLVARYVALRYANILMEGETFQKAGARIPFRFCCKEYPFWFEIGSSGWNGICYNSNVTSPLSSGALKKATDDGASKARV
jgi:hypothetical protein